MEKVSIILGNIFSGQIYNSSRSFAPIYIFNALCFTLAVSFVLTSWKILNIDTVQFYHQQIIKANEVFENSAYEEISVRPSSVQIENKVSGKDSTDVCEANL